MRELTTARIFVVVIYISYLRFSSNYKAKFGVIVLAYFLTVIGVNANLIITDKWSYRS